MWTDNYIRVIPRDLFNEAKLLKCLGQLCLNIHNGTIPCKITVEENGSPFDIRLLDEGALIIDNLTFKIKGIRCYFKTTYNSKSNYPLHCEHNDCEYLVFDEQGNFDEEFIQFCKTIKK